MMPRYDEQIHRAYYPLDQDRIVPERYSAIVSRGRRFLHGSATLVLEVGSENPQNALFWIRELGLQTEQAILAEISTQAVRLLKAAKLRAVQADISDSRLPFPDESVDLVILSEVIEHLLDSDHALEELWRVMRPTAGLILTTPNLASWANRVQLSLGLQPIGTETGTEWVFGRGPLVPVSRPVGHLQVFTLRALLELLQYHRLDPIEIVGLPYSGHILPARRLRPFDSLFARFPSLSSSVLVVSVKGR